ncbi:ABC-2 family transporter protein [Candidatus Gottesmanbacteria bacterium]|nr:ABC-2 family transporter protein [Candidatus Gottesmanbacteria bacterium]
MNKYISTWYLMSLNSFASMLVSRLGGLLFLLGKTLRFIFFLIFLLIITQKQQTIAGYTQSQAILFFLTFNVIDTTSQFFFREVYRFRQLVVSGNLDLVLIKPISPLFRSLLGGADIFDLFMIIPFIVATAWVALLQHPTVIDSILFILLIFSGLGIAAAFHILVLALGILTTEIDHAVMIYRDLTSTGRIPIDVYREPVRGFLTFIVPVGIMMTTPAKALLGLVSPFGVIFAFAVSGISILISLFFWQFALRRYTSASS